MFLKLYRRLRLQTVLNRLKETAAWYEANKNNPGTVCDFPTSIGDFSKCYARGEKEYKLLAFSYSKKAADCAYLLSVYKNPEMCTILGNTPSELNFSRRILSGGFGRFVTKGFINRECKLIKFMNNLYLFDKKCCFNICLYIIDNRSFTMNGEKYGEYCYSDEICNIVFELIRKIAYELKSDDIGFEISAHTVTLYHCKDEEEKYKSYKYLYGYINSLNISENEHLLDGALLLFDYVTRYRTDDRKMITTLINKLINESPSDKIICKLSRIATEVIKSIKSPDELNNLEENIVHAIEKFNDAEFLKLIGSNKKTNVETALEICCRFFMQQETSDIFHESIFGYLDIFFKQLITISPTTTSKALNNLGSVYMNTESTYAVRLFLLYRDWLGIIYEVSPQSSYLIYPFIGGHSGISFSQNKFVGNKNIHTSYFNVINDFAAAHPDTLADYFNARRH